MNLVQLFGRLTKDPDIRYSQSGMAIARFTLAVNRMKQGDADFIQCLAFDKTAQIIEKHLKKGLRVGLQGRIQTGSYDNKEGQKVYTTDIIVDRLEMIDWADQQTKSTEPISDEPTPQGFSAISDDIPF